MKANHTKAFEGIPALEEKRQAQHKDTVANVTKKWGILARQDFCRAFMMPCSSGSHTFGALLCQ